MARKKNRGRKVRVDFKQNRTQRRRSDEWTRRYHAGDEELGDEHQSESVRAKGALSRKRTIIADENDLPARDSGEWISGIVTKVHGLICYVTDPDGKNWECTVRRVLRTLLIEKRSPVTCGDRVWFSDVSEYHENEPVGVIERVDDRRTTLSRRDRRKREHTIVANAEQLLIVMSIAEPRLKPHLLDRYLVAAHRGGLEPVICFNKADLLAEDLTADTQDEDVDVEMTVEGVIQEFRDLGYRALLTSATQQTGLESLRDALRDKITVLSGQSGVGKSSLLNVIEPTLDLSVQTVSAETQKGKHTTTHAELHPLSFGGWVVDTPGIRAFDLWNVAPGELEAYFPEISPHVPECQFSDCTHRHEKGCAVIAAVDAGEISERRFCSYLKMFEEV
jgi:ribosome biogenesis GTPase